MITSSREYEIFFLLERRLVTRLSKFKFRHSIRSALSPWLIFWLFFGGFFFTVNAYLWLQSLTSPLNSNIEYFAIGGGIVFSLVVGFFVLGFAKPGETNWRLPVMIFFLWMVAPSIFPLLFLFGIFAAQDTPIDLQTSPWRTAADYAFFAAGLILLIVNRDKVVPTHGALTIMAIAALFILKTLTSDAFYFFGKCPTVVFNENYAWFSNSSDEVSIYRQKDPKGRFYKSPVGQLFCTRTREDLFR